MHKNKYPNELLVYRSRRGLNRKEVCAVLGLKHHGSLSRYERGETMPSLVTALRLETLYRTPVAFLYAPLYQQIKAAVRTEEEKLQPPAAATPRIAEQTP